VVHGRTEIWWTFFVVSGLIIKGHPKATLRIRQVEDLVRPDLTRLVPTICVWLSSFFQECVINFSINVLLLQNATITEENLIWELVCWRRVSWQNLKRWCINPSWIASNFSTSSIITLPWDEVWFKSYGYPITHQYLSWYTKFHRNRVAQAKRWTRHWRCLTETTGKTIRVSV
jgi:hypothetical protein